MNVFKLGFAVGAAMLASVGVANAQQQVVKVWGQTDSAPFSFHDPATNTDQGTEIDLITAIGKDAGFSVQVLFDTIANAIPNLNSNKVDVVAFVISPERAQQIAFSDPVFTYGEGLIVAKNDPKDYKSWDDLKGEVVGAVAGSAFIKPLMDSGVFKEVKAYPGQLDVLRAVAAGEVKGGFLAGPPAIWQVEKLNLVPGLRMAKSYLPRVVSPYAFGVRKTDTALLAKINTSLAKLKADGTLPTILTKYGY